MSFRQGKSLHSFRAPESNSRILCMTQALHNGAVPKSSHAREIPANLKEWVDASLVLQEDWETLHPDVKDEIANCADEDKLFRHLVDHNLLTEYQAARIVAGTTFGLVLGSYRVLSRLGAGGMGVVFLAEHIRMRRQVAIKVF